MTHHVEQFQSDFVSTSLNFKYVFVTSYYQKSKHFLHYWDDFIYLDKNWSNISKPFLEIREDNKNIVWSISSTFSFFPRLQEQPGPWHFSKLLELVMMTSATGPVWMIQLRRSPWVKKLHPHPLHSCQSYWRKATSWPQMPDWYVESLTPTVRDCRVPK